MFFVKALYCRIFQIGFRLALPLLPYREPEIVSSCSKIPEVFEKEHRRSALIVTDRGIVNNGLTKPLEDVLTAHNIEYVVYDKT